MINILNAYQKAWEILLKSKTVWLIIYLFNLMFALIAAYPFHQFLTKVAGNSNAISDNIGKFDFNFLADLSNNYGQYFALVSNQAKVLAVIYFFVMIFFSAGLYYIMVNFNKKLKSANFWQGCHHYFWRFLRLNIYVLLMHIALLLFEWFLFNQITGGINFFELESDATLLNGFKIMLPIIVLLHSLVFIFQDYTKIEIIKQDLNLITIPIKNAFKFLIKNLPQVILLAALVFATSTLGIYILNKFISVAESSNFLQLLYVVLFTQIIIIYQVAMKILHVASITSYYDIKEKQEYLVNTNTETLEVL